MTESELSEYFALYNSGQFETAVAAHYTQDAVFEMPGDEPDHVGSNEILKWFQERGTSGYTEKLRPVNVVMNDTQIAVELIAEYHAYEDVPDFPIRPLKKGDSLSRRDGVFYDLRDGKICRVCVYTR